MDEFIELLREASALGYAGKTSIVDRLLSEDWCVEENLAFAYAALRDSDRPVIVVFFELPYRVNLPDRKWLHVPAPYGNPYICFAAMVPSATSGIDQGASSRPRTQVMASFQLWGRRREFYDDYLAAVASPGSFGSHIVSTGESWLPSRAPLTPAIYEADLATRVYAEAYRMVREFIPIYMVAARDPGAHIPQSLGKYFIMTKNGRLVAKAPENSASQLVEVLTETDHSGNFKRLRGSISSGRPPSVYERYLLEAARQASSGATSLAVVYTVMVLDWLANELIRDGILRTVDQSLKHTGKIADLVRDRLWESDIPNGKSRTQVRTPEEFDKYLPAIGLELPEVLHAQLNDVIKLRNRIIHKTQTAVIERSAADHAIEVGMRVIEFCMQKRIELVNKKGTSLPAGPAK